MKTIKDLRIPFTWEERRPIILDRFFYLPGHYEKHATETNLHWSSPEVFGNDQPVAIEYCSGNGQWIGEKAKQNPHINWVAVDKLFERSRKVWAKMHRENIPNLFVVCGEAEPLTKHYIQPETVSEIYVNFPDPWPKLRHAKNRLFQVPFLNDLEKIVVPGGKATFVTDDAPYSGQMIEQLGKCPKWRSILPAPYYTNHLPDFGPSFFSELWKGKGRTIYYHFFEKI